MTNADVARVFNEVADMLEIKGADTFRINSYRRVARTLADLATDVAGIAARGELSGLPGVGKGSAAKIQELLETGKLGYYERLKEDVPESLRELLQIPRADALGYYLPPLRGCWRGRYLHQNG